MKSIDLKVGKEEINGRQTVLTTYDLLRISVNNGEQGGFNVDEMMKRLRILEALDKHKDMFSLKEGAEESYLNNSETLHLEDSDFQKLKELFNQTKWSVVSKFIVDLHKEINEK
jgi:hypothetical protein